jgi:hypothetical protein
MKNLIAKSRSAIANSPLGRFLSAVRHRGDEGMATAEYAIGILIIIAIGGVLFKVFTDGAFRQLVFNLIKFIFENITKLI